MTEPATDAQAIIDTAIAAAKVQHLDPADLYGVTVPAEGQHVVVDLERHLPAPRRTHGQVALYEAASLSAYVAAHAEAGTALYADVDTAQIVAVINGHHLSTPGWGDHRATLTLRKTPEWKRWEAKDGQIGRQQAFAEHIEDSQADIVDPPAADMLELAQHFHATTNVAFRSSKRLSDGQTQVLYEETIDARAGQRGDLTIPKEFVLGIRPFEGTEPYRVLARMRFRLVDGALTIGYVLDRPQDVLRAAFNDVVLAVEQATTLLAYRGKSFSA